MSYSGPYSGELQTYAGGYSGGRVPGAPITPSGYAATPGGSLNTGTVPLPTFPPGNGRSGRSWDSAPQEQPVANTTGAQEGPLTLLISGNQRIEDSTITSHMKLPSQDALTPQILDKAVKDLYATGLFSDINIVRDGSTVMVSVQENPVINRLAFEGNEDIADDTLSTEVQLRPRVVYTRDKVQSDTRRILEIYRRAGRFAAQVTPKIIELSDNRVDLVFEIDEGDITRVSRIFFIGNRHFSDATLRGVILTQEERWYRFLARDDTYDPDRLTFDQEVLRRFYLQNGYIDFQVSSAVAELTPDLKNFFITFTLEEGSRYRVGDVSVKTKIRKLEDLDIEDDIATKSGDWYDAKKVEETITAITEASGSLGYAFVNVRPEVERLPDKKLVNINYVVDEREQVFVEQININGNVRTLDKVIRREIELVEGDAFNIDELRRSQRLLTNLGIFDKVEITNTPGGGPDRTIINVEVAERATGEFSVGAGFSSRDGALGNVGVRERNLLGRGQDLSLNLGISARTQEIDLSFTEPYFLDRDLSAGFDIFRVRRNYRRESGFAERSIGAGVRMGYELFQDVRQTWRYTLRQDTVSDIRSGVSRFIEDQKGTTIKSTIGQSLTMDLRNDRVDPSEGYIVQVSTNFAGLGGSVRYFETVLKAAFYYPFAPGWVGSASVRGGHIFALKDKVRLVDRFFLGGDDLRGFAFYGVGPRDISTGDSLGGETYAVTQLELDFPLGLPKELGISGRLFSDIGTLSTLPDRGPEIRKSATPRVSVGVGIAWRSPFGPVQIFYGKPLVKEPYDKVEAIRFSFGTRF